MLNLLVANDDGYRSKGINILTEYLRSVGHNVTIVSPADQCSSESHAMTEDHPIRVDQRGEQLFVVHGTPTDCVVLGIKCILKNLPPDYVITGINHGLNVGIEVNYSGTIGSASKAVLMGHKAIAVSAETSSLRDDSHKLHDLLLESAKCVNNLLNSIHKIEWPASKVLSLNIPLNHNGLKSAICTSTTKHTPSVEELPKHFESRIFYLGGIVQTAEEGRDKNKEDIYIIQKRIATLSFLNAKQISDGTEQMLKFLERNY